MSILLWITIFTMYWYCNGGREAWLSDTHKNRHGILQVSTAYSFLVSHHTSTTHRTHRTHRSSVPLLPWSESFQGKGLYLNSVIYLGVLILQGYSGIRPSQYLVRVMKQRRSRSRPDSHGHGWGIIVLCVMSLRWWVVRSARPGICKNVSVPVCMYVCMYAYVYVCINIPKVTFKFNSAIEWRPAEQWATSVEQLKSGKRTSWATPRGTTDALEGAWWVWANLVRHW